MADENIFQPPFSTSLRAKYGTSELQNALHGSASVDVAVREIKFMFPNCKYSTHIHLIMYNTLPQSFFY